jgi:hypothetical protein
MLAKAVTMQSRHRRIAAFTPLHRATFEGTESNRKTLFSGFIEAV